VAEQITVYVNLNTRNGIVNLALILVSALTVLSGWGIAHASAESPAQLRSPYHPVRMPASAHYYYQTVWGIDNLVLRSVASGNLIRFSYRVTNVNRASELGNKRAEPMLIDPKRKIALQIPVMEQVGPLWQAVGLENGKRYWMTFSNKGSPVHVGDRVSVVVGSFHADGLLVE